MSNIPWYQDDAADTCHILSSRVRLARNFKKYPFKRKLDTVQGNEMIAEAANALTMAGGHRYFRNLDINGLGASEQKVFLEKHIVSPEFLSGTMPKDLFISDDQNVSVMLGEEDHIRIQSVKPGEALTGALETASQVDDLIEERVEYAFHSEYGFLTSCPTNTGTGLRASYMIHLPCLEKSDLLKNLLPKITKFGVTLRGIYGEGTAPMGSIYQISNQTTLGKSEDVIIQGLQNVTENVISNERIAREKYVKTRREDLEDKVYRAYGILSNCRIITAKEAMDLLSDIRLGYLTGVLEKPMPRLRIYQIMMEIQPGHLQRAKGEEMSDEEMNSARALYLRGLL